MCFCRQCVCFRSDSETVAHKQGERVHETSHGKMADRPLPSRVEVSEGVGEVAGHASNNAPFAAQVFDHDGRQEHGGDDDGGVDDAQRGHAHPLLGVQAALHTQPQGMKLNQSLNKFIKSMS